MFTLISWGGRKILSNQSAKRRWLRRLLFLLAVVRWIDRRYQSKGTIIALRKGETLLVSVQKNGNSSK
jgi:hypothetical protein